MDAKSTILDRCLWRLHITDPNSPLRAHPRVMLGILGYHALALLACLPWLFSWSGLAWAVAGFYIFGTLGINIGYHRLLTHRGFACARWLEKFLTILGVCCWQGSPMSWAAIHRMHHQKSDETEDPHTPLRNFFWSHMGWFMMYSPSIWNISTYDHYARDLLRDRFIKSFERTRVWRTVHVLQWLTFFVAGAALGAFLTSWDWLGSLQMGLSWLVWGVFVRTVAVWHITWSVNSFTHVWGYRNFNTRDNSRNNWLVGLISNGEGWHNNHHAQPRSASHGMRWWELDISYLTIRVFQVFGLAWNVVQPHRELGDISDAQNQTVAA